MKYCSFWVGGGGRESLFGQGDLFAKSTREESVNKFSGAPRRFIILIFPRRSLTPGKNCCFDVAKRSDPSEMQKNLGDEYLGAEYAQQLRWSARRLDLASIKCRTRRPGLTAN